MGNSNELKNIVMKQANYIDLKGTPPNSATCQGVIEGHLEINQDELKETPPGGGKRKNSKGTILNKAKRQKVKKSHLGGERCTKF
jgi:hypothetical protein